MHFWKVIFPPKFHNYLQNQKEKYVIIKEYKDYKDFKSKLFRLLILDFRIFGKCN